MRSSLALTLLLVASTVLSSCASSSITPRGNVKASATPLSAMPVWRLGAGELIVTELFDDTQLALKRVEGTGRTVWSTPLRMPESKSSSGLVTTPRGKLGFGVMSMPDEITMLTFGSTSALNMLSYRFGEDDSVYIVGRRFDLASGRELESRVLFAASLGDEVEERYRSINSAFSADSSHLVIYSVERGADALEYYVKTTIVDRELRDVRTGRTRVETSSPRHYVQSVGVDSEGSAYVVSIVNGTDVRVDRHTLKGESTNMTARFDTPGRDEQMIARAEYVIEAPGRLLVMAPTSSDDDLASINVARIDFKDLDPKYLKRTPITGASLESMAGVDEFEYPHAVKIVRHDGATPYVLVLQSRYVQEVTRTEQRRGSFFGNSSTTRYNVEGDMLLVGLDAEGAVRWMRRVRNLNQSMDMNLPPQMTLAMGKSQITSHVTRGGRLHVMTRNQEGLNLYDVNLKDGSIRNPDGEVLLDMGNAAHAFPGFTTWLDDERVQLLISQGVFSRDYSLYDVNYAGR